MRNLTKTLAIISLLTPVVGYPLGIGDLKLHSALNQNLNAEIPLTLSAGEDAQDIKVTLAPAAKFDEAGVPWTYFLSKIRFQVVNTKGSTVIRVSSSEALKEPFLNMLVQVSWPKGNLVREFTVLVDPPSSYKQTLPISTPSDVSKPAIITSVPSANTAKVTAPVVAPVNNAPVNNKAAVFTPASPPSTTAARSAVANPVVTNAVPVESVSSESSSYGPIHKKETMWSIGVKFGKERGVSVEQMLMAIYQANPGAFNRNNVFGLMSGAVLDIPGKDVAENLSSEQAREAYALQKKAWKSGATLPDYSSTIAEKEDVTQSVATLPAAPVTPYVPNRSGKPSLTFSGDGQKKISTEPLKVPQAAVPPVAPQKTPEVAREVATSPAAPLKLPEAEKEPEISPTDAELLKRVAILEKQLKATKKTLAEKENILKQTQTSKTEQPENLQSTLPPTVSAPAESKPNTPATPAPEAAKPVETTTPAVVLKTIDSSVSFDPIGDFAKLEAPQPAIPIELIKPVVAPAPTLNSEPATDVVKPTTPVEVVKPATPVEALKPVAPTTPVAPEAAKPVVPTTPVAPEAAKPVVPTTPVAPEAAKPVAPTTPVAPEAAKPVAPTTPVAPEAAKPVAPTTPVAPEAAKPVAPTTPVAPEAVKPVAPTTPPAPVVPAPVEPDEEPGLMELIDSNSEYVGGAAGGLLVIGFVGWWLRNRKRAMEEPMFPVSPKVEFKGISTSDTTAADTNLNLAFNASEFQGKSIFEPDWNIDIETEQTEIDPISEADVYLAYARYQQAEELMRDAIKDQPNRDECKLKLLEIFYASENKDAFLSYADELAKAGKRSDSEFWDKVIEMGGEICPGSALFSLGADDGEVGKTVSKPATKDVSSASTEQLKPSSETHAPKPEARDVVSSLDNLSEFDDFEDEFPVGQQQRIDVDKSVSPPDDEDDFDTFNFDEEASKSEMVALAKDDTDTFDFDGFDDFAMDDKPVAKPVAVEAVKDDLETFDFDDFAMDDKPVAKPAAVEAVKDDLETFDFDDFAVDDKPVVTPAVAAVKDDLETFDFDDFAVDDKPVVTPAVAAVKDDLETFDFDDFAMDDKPVVTPAVATVKDDLETFDFDDFAMDDKPVVTPAVAAVKDDLETFDFDDFAVDDKPVVTPAVAAVKDDLETFDFDDFAVDDKPVVTPAVVAVKDDLETFDFDDFAVDDKPVVTPAVAAVKDDLEEFDFDDFAMDDKPVVTPSVEAVKEDLETFDFDDFGIDDNPVVGTVKDDLETFDFDDFVVPTKIVAEPAIAAKDGLENFEFDDFLTENKVDAIPPAVKIDVKDDQEIFDFDTPVDDEFVSASGQSSADFDFDFDFDMPGTGLENQGSFGVADLGNMDDLGTKLDIAKAYIEMGETEAARDITEEILKNGTAEQKKTAESLLERLK